MTSFRPTEGRQAHRRQTMAKLSVGRITTYLILLLGAIALVVTIFFRCVLGESLYTSAMFFAAFVIALLLPVVVAAITKWQSIFLGGTSAVLLVALLLSWDYLSLFLDAYVSDNRMRNDESVVTYADPFEFAQKNVWGWQPTLLLFEVFAVVGTLGGAGVGYLANKKPKRSLRLEKATFSAPSWMAEGGDSNAASESASKPKPPAPG